MNPIRDYRKRHELSQQTLADQLNIRSGEISKYENGLKVPAAKAIVWSQMIPELELFVLRPDLKWSESEHPVH